MIHTKFCCNGQNAVMIEPLYPITRIRNGQQVKFFTAIYKCKVCSGLTLRGESQQRTWNTLVEYINEEQKAALLKERLPNGVAKAITNEVQNVEVGIGTGSN